ncbi:MAG: thioredoxin family protein [Candidatus Korobacteraceae bacterium]
MAQTPSTMLPLGTKLPAFRLPDSSGKMVSSESFQSAPVLVVAFICNHCPFVKHIREKLVELARMYQGRGVAFVGINSNDAEKYPDDAPAAMAQIAKSFGFSFPYLYDESQETAKAFQAACTPDFFVFDQAQKLAYRGQFDESRPGNDQPVTGDDLRKAMDAMLEGKAAPQVQKASLGCNIKWKAGNEPQYYSQPVTVKA